MRSRLQLWLGDFCISSAEMSHVGRLQNVFVVDNSASMGMLQPSVNGRGQPAQTRMRTMKQKLLEALGNLNRAQYFLLITFSTHVDLATIWQQATPNQISLAKSRIHAWKATGTSNTLEALQAARAQCKWGLQHQYGIYLLSDGVPDET